MPLQDFRCSLRAAPCASLRRGDPFLVRQAQLPTIFAGGTTGLNFLHFVPLGQEARECDPEEAPCQGCCNPGKHDLQ